MFFSKKDSSREEQRKAKLEEQLKDVDPSKLVSAFNHDIDDNEVEDKNIYLDDDIIIPPDLDLNAKFKKP